MSRLETRIGACIAAAVLVAGLTLLALRAEQAFSNVAALYPLDVAQRGHWFLDTRLKHIDRDRGRCAASLKPPIIRAAPIADHVPSEGCGWINAVRVDASAGARLAVAAITCELAIALALWLEHEVQPMALELLGSRVAEVKHMGSYACRNIRGNPADADLRSEHARANALDVRAFLLANGRQVGVLQHWEAAGAEGRFLRAVHARACRYFRVAIGPAFNAAHRDHFHLDRGADVECR